MIKQVMRDKYFLLLLAPVLIYYVIFKYVPMFGIVISFKNYNLFKGIWDSEWVGLKYYIQFFTNPDAFELIRNTFLLGAYKLLFGFPAPIILALLLNEVRWSIYKRFVQTVSYLPHFISVVVVAGMLTLFLSPTIGFINDVIKAFGFQPINFLMEAGWFRTIYVASGIWQEAGWGSIIYLAALTTVDPQLYEAAEIDGAGRWKRMLHVTLPGIAPAMVILLVLNAGQILEIGFEKVFLLYNPATYETADVISTYVYRTGIVKGNFSYGTAVDLFMGVISFIFVFSANYASRRLGETSLW
ncbi:sugar ABC transporter permease [Gordoniibacillus kamchatkensis]|uniref:Sugar ABC transporter permease n=1 Tax=Gordoniibacillus kamchatkensis TaxID=1590651 RepID=A0ABR5ALR2_9BACL|nr:ABC transporter permease subunit [Paenibacillus sp. VKM B-2647]KIL41901.1 sugar ABC transporter permease [Paenibacillus sp. VKM B-2647]